MTFSRVSTGLAALDQALGGGMVPGSVILLAGKPGVGKTTLVLQTLARLGHSAVYASGDESLHSLWGTTRRIGAVTPQLSFIADRDLHSVFTHARELQAKTIAVDPIQMTTNSNEKTREPRGSAKQILRSVASLRAFTQTSGATVWIVGHVNNRGEIVNRRIVDEVDTVLVLRSGTHLDGHERVLRCTKNRFGSETVGSFELTANGTVDMEASRLTA